MATAETISIEEFRRLDLRVARVVGATRVEGADRLLRLEVVLGDERRQIVAGIARHYAPAALVGRDIVVVANLAPARIRGLESQGMLLAAATPGDAEVVLLTTDRPVPSGSRVR